MLSLCFRCLPFSFVLSLVLDVDGGDPLAALLKQLQAVLRSVRHLHWDLICVPGQNGQWKCISNRNGRVSLTWYHLGQLHTQLRASQMRLPSADTPWRRSPGGEGELFQVNFSWGSYFVATPPKLWCFQHKGRCLTCPARGCFALPPFSPELPPLRTSVIWSGHSCALLLTYIIVSSR